LILKDKSEQAKQYLLGRLSETNKSRFEEDYFTDHELFEELEIAEDELVDAYIRHELSDKDREDFEANLSISPRLAERVVSARTLATSIRRTPPATIQVYPVSAEVKTITPQPTRQSGVVDEDKSPFWRRILFPKALYSSPGLAVTATTLLFLLGGGALFFGWMRLRTESSRLALERAEIQRRNQDLVRENEKQKSELTAQIAEARAENERLLQQLNSASNSQRHTLQREVNAVLLLFPGGLRSSGRRSVVEISGHTASVKLRLALRSVDYKTYSATVKTAEQTPIWSKAQLKPRSSSADATVVDLVIPSSRLPAGTYVVELSGSNDSANAERLPDYSFHVVRKGN